MDKGEFEKNHNLPLGIGNPKELGDSEVALYECHGETYSIIDFVKKHKHLLECHEQHLIDRCHDFLAQIEIPEILNNCLTRSSEFSDEPSPLLTAKRSGGRSAFWIDHNYKFKGCRPVLDDADFPIESLPFGDQKINYSRIPFGTMRAESVMREILGFCFTKTYQLNVHSVPICVYEYWSKNGSLGCCLVSKSEGEVRIEEFIEYPDCTIEDLIKANLSGKHAIKGCPTGTELNLNDVNIWWYVEQKSDFLVKMHFNGGFRGILNSNIGNDVIVKNESGKLLLYLCDFDTFGVVPIPNRPEKSFIEAFVLQCMVEAAKGSLSILEYVDLPEDFSHAQIADVLGNIYFNKSSLWHAYKRKFYQNAKLQRWDLNLVEEAFEKMGRTEAFANILCGCVLNSHYVSELSKTRDIFYPHN